MNVTEHRASDLADPAQDAAIAALLEICFDGAHEGRTFYKQIPQARLLAWEEGRLVGHLGLDYRVVRAGEAVLPTLGIIDLCVAPTARRRGIGETLLRRAEDDARGQSFALAMADDRRLYERAGYGMLPAASVTFLAMDELRCHSVIERDLREILMIKRLKQQDWPEGSIDLLGYLF